MRVLGVTVLALAILAAACNPFGGLAPDELPDEIGPREREQIEETLRRFFEGVNRYNAQVASEVMLTPAELGRPEECGAGIGRDVDRLTLVVAMSGRCQDQIDLALLVMIDAERHILVTCNPRVDQYHLAAR